MNTRLILLLIIFSSLFIYSQTNQIARYAGEELFSREFKMRFELTPIIRSSTKIDSQKTHFLYTLLAEKLWAKEARNLGLDSSQIYQQYILNLEKMLVRDALFKQNILNKVTISEDEIADGIIKKQQELFFKFLFSRSKDEIDSLFMKLSSVPFDTLLKGRSENLEQESPISVVYGQLDPEIEQIVYDLQPGEFTNPIQQEIGWVIYYMVGKRILDESIIGNNESVRSSAVDIIKRRKLQSKMNEYLNELLSDVNVDTDGTLFRTLANKLSEYISKKYLENSKNYILYEDDILNLMRSFTSNQLESNFIKFVREPITLKDFILYLYFRNFTAGGKDLNSVSISLNSMIRDFIRSEIISREAYSRNLHMLPEIKQELKMWEDNFLSQYLRNRFNKQARVTDVELEEFIGEETDSLIITDLVSITKVKLESLDQAQFIFSQLQYNYEFEEVIKNLNLDPALITKNEELQPVGSFGELSQIITQMKEGEVYGPINGENGFLIIKLNKRLKKQLSDLEKNIAQLDYKKDELFYKKLSKILNEETVKLAKKYGLVVDESLLSNIKVTEIPTMVYRNYGFGGRTAAAPFINLFYEWYYNYKQEKDAL